MQEDSDSDSDSGDLVSGDAIIARWSAVLKTTRSQAISLASFAPAIREH
jgi:hypothetical protein